MIHHDDIFNPTKLNAREDDYSSLVDPTYYGRLILQ